MFENKNAANNIEEEADFSSPWLFKHVKGNEWNANSRH